MGGIGELLFGQILDLLGNRVGLALEIAFANALYKILHLVTMLLVICTKIQVWKHQE